MASSAPSSVRSSSSWPIAANDMKLRGGRVNVATATRPSRRTDQFSGTPPSIPSMAEVTAGTTTEQGLLDRWREVLRTTNPPSSGQLDPVSKWLVLTPAAGLPMTLTAGVVAGLLAVRDDDLRGRWVALAPVGSLLAHAANTLMNDLFDSGVGLDTENYPRALYAPHPILSGLISRKRLASAALVVNLVDLAILVVLTAVQGWAIVGFALA